MAEGFKDGDMVRMTRETRKVNSGARSWTGVVVQSKPNHHGEVKILRDGLKTVENWHPVAWELISSPERA